MSSTFTLPAWLIGAFLIIQACRPSEPIEQNSFAYQNSVTTDLSPRESCKPVLIQIPAEHAMEQVGNWQYVFNVLLVGCETDLNNISAQQRQAILGLAVEEIRHRGLDIAVQFKAEELRSHLRAEINKMLGYDAVGDVYLNLLMSAESM